jgi:hypothetical protein
MINLAYVVAVEPYTMSTGIGTANVMLNVRQNVLDNVWNNIDRNAMADVRFNIIRIKPTTEQIQKALDLL